MKTIVVPTDFSPSAENALNYAARLAQITDGALSLLHVYQVPVSMNDVPVLMVSAEGLKRNADAALERAREQLQFTYPTLAVSVESRLGDVAEELKEFCAGVEPFAIVVGKHGASGVERFLFGSTTLSIIRQLNYPVIAVPDSTTSFRLANLALAADDTASTIPETTIREFVQSASSRMHIVHVQEGGGDTLYLKNLLPDLHPVYRTIRNEDFLHGIETYVRTHDIDLLIIHPHKHSFLERLFFKTHTAELVEKLKIPVMTIKSTE